MQRIVVGGAWRPCAAWALVGGAGAGAATPVPVSLLAGNASIPGIVAGPPLCAAPSHQAPCSPHAQERIFDGRQPGPKEGVLPLALWSDKGVARLGGRAYHPVNLALITQSRDTVFKRAFYLHLGFVHVLDKNTNKRCAAPHGKGKGRARGHAAAQS